MFRLIFRTLVSLFAAVQTILYSYRQIQKNSIQYTHHELRSNKMKGAKCEGNKKKCKRWQWQQQNAKLNEKKTKQKQWQNRKLSASVKHKLVFEIRRRLSFCCAANVKQRAMGQRGCNEIPFNTTTRPNCVPWRRLSGYVKMSHSSSNWKIGIQKRHTLTTEPQRQTKNLANKRERENTPRTATNEFPHNFLSVCCGFVSSLFFFFLVVQSNVLTLLLFQFHLIRIPLNNFSLYRMKTMIHCIWAVENGNASDVEVVTLDQRRLQMWSVAKKKPRRIVEKPNTNAVDTYTEQEMKNTREARDKKRRNLGKWEITTMTKTNLYTRWILKRCYHRQTLCCRHE